LAGPALNSPNIYFLILFPVSASRQDAVCHSIMHIMSQIRESYVTQRSVVPKLTYPQSLPDHVLLSDYRETALSNGEMMLGSFQLQSFVSKKIQSITVSF
jgi:hypothetical protein